MSQTFNTKGNKFGHFLTETKAGHITLSITGMANLAVSAHIITALFPTAF
jgi:hypothetical protein